MQVLLGESPGEFPSNIQPTYAGLVAVMEACHAQARYWTFDPMALLKMRVQLDTAQAKLKGAVYCFLLLQSCNAKHC